MESPTPSFLSGTSIRSNPTSPPPSQQNECDYDVNPTFLYQAIEAKQWQHVADFLTTQEEATQQCSTWVIRKERNGQLRWRLLPLHAAVIFASPLHIIELLLQEYPAAAHLKDDQGMLPLHLCFRNFQQWEILEELLTCYPQGILVKDRKGRTPLQCACSSFRKQASVLELYTHVAVTQERQRTLREHSTTLEAKIQALQTTHVSTLERFKQDWQVQSETLQSELLQTQEAYGKLQQDHAALKLDFEEKLLLEHELTSKLTQVTEALTAVTEVDQEYSGLVQQAVQHENSSLKKMVQDLLTTQQELLDKLQQYSDDRREKKQRQHDALQQLLQGYEEDTTGSELSILQRDWQLTNQQVVNQLAALNITTTTTEPTTNTNTKQQEENEDETTSPRDEMAILVSDTHDTDVDEDVNAVE